MVAWAVLGQNRFRFTAEGCGHCDPVRHLEKLCQQHNVALRCSDVRRGVAFEVLSACVSSMPVSQFRQGSLSRHNNCRVEAVASEQGSLEQVIVAAFLAEGQGKS